MVVAWALYQHRKRTYCEVLVPSSTAHHGIAAQAFARNLWAHREAGVRVRS